MKISGYTCVRNGLSLDYCFMQCIDSLLPVCDEVVVCDSDSTDGTAERLEQLAAAEPKIRVINRQWPSPERNIHWWTEWINDTRKHLQHPFQLMLDADEVLPPETIERLLDFRSEPEFWKSCLFFDRHNFYGDARHIAQEGHVCGRFVARFGPTGLYMPSDEIHPRVHPNVRDTAIYDTHLKIFHYGFMRKDAAFYAKSDVVQKGFFGETDKRVLRCRDEGLDWMKEIPVPLDEFTGEHPPQMIPWLKERGRL